MTTSVGSVPAAQDSWGSTVSRNALKVHMGMDVGRYVTV